MEGRDIRELTREIKELRKSFDRFTDAIVNSKAIDTMNTLAVQFAQYQAESNPPEILADNIPLTRNKSIFRSS